MTRTKVKIEYITNDLNRKTSFTKRKKGLIKKVDELTTLCGVDGCAIVFGQHDQEPEVWPSRLGVQRMLAKFRLLPDLQQATKMENQESFTRERIKKAQEKLRKMKQENREKEMTHMMFKCFNGEGSSNMNLEDLNEIRSLADLRVKDIGSRIEALKKERESLARTATLTDGTTSSANKENGATTTENNQWNIDSLLLALNSQVQGPSFSPH